MPASWAELIRATVALLQGFSADPSAVSDESGCYREVEQCLLRKLGGMAGMAGIQLAEDLQVSAEAALDICRPVVLAFGSGRQAAAHAAEALRLYDATFPVSSDAARFGSNLGSMLAIQVSLAHLGLVLAGKEGALRMLAQRMMPPRAGEDTLGLPSSLVGLLTDVCYKPALANHAELLQADTALSAGLVALLLPAFAKAAVAQRLPADRQPPGFDWSTAPGLAGLLSSRLRPALLQHLAAADDAAVLRLLKSAAAVTSEARPSEPGLVAVLLSHADAAALLGVVAECAAERQCKQQAAGALLAAPLLRQLGSALQLALAAEGIQRQQQQHDKAAQVASMHALTLSLLHFASGVADMCRQQLGGSEAPQGRAP
ncbi:hypothetical protein ABPG75_003444 [Micractinium tetrahymenae]